MEINYTPLDLNKLTSKVTASIPVREESKVTTVLIVIATITAAVLAGLLFVLIQKKQLRQNTNQPTMIITPTIISTPFPTVNSTPESTISATPAITSNFKISSPSPTSIVSSP